ncbi:MAG: hypothetical protein E6Q62_10010 [Nitrosomonas sp.]|nr:MAG: hypothetical protein E6Q62_10010 [Nitrosomonas sp.]
MKEDDSPEILRLYHLPGESAEGWKNWIERFNKTVRKTTQHVNSFPNPDAALNWIFMVTKQMKEKIYRIPITSFYPFK